MNIISSPEVGIACRNASTSHVKPVRAMLLFFMAFALCFAWQLTASPVAYAKDAGLVAAEASAVSTQADEQPRKPAYTTVAKVKLNKKRATIRNNGTVQFEATLVGADEALPIKKTKVTWSVSKPKVARITQDGVVQGKRPGTVKVTATAANGVKATAKVKVIVNKKKMATRIPVLTYHRITTDRAKARYYNNTNLAISKGNFQRQMRWLKENGYTTVSTTEFADWRLEGAFLPKKSVLITIDDGFYETYHVAYPVLKKYGLKATSFVIGVHVGKKTPSFNESVWWDRYVGRDVIKEVRAEYPNLEFQSHTYNMHHRSGSLGVAKSWSRKSIDADFKKNAKFGFTAIAYPFGHTSDNLYASLRSNADMRIGFGYMMYYPATRTSPRYNIPRFKVFGDQGLESFKSIVRTAG